ncbi:MAG TPA: FAD:protein FMN transferase [Candidatus Tenderia electrophaga]|uniref:FAD:protein FMN transferase n=1 Tax=Candidatus Tenderia electrophaga TaxID=1748243 RepID=A0A832J7M4_9GAMM|nr:FAD:protein FMN transferase [Candidatus Tenderia electrophaga]
MRRSIIRGCGYIITLILCLVLSACQQRPPLIYQQQVLALGTLVDISIYGVDEETAARAVTSVTNTMETIHHHWHAWQPSKLTYINQQLAAGNTVSLNPEQQQLIQTGITLARQSNDLFNPAAGKLIALWGFHSDERPDAAPPADSEIKALVQADARMSRLTLDGNQLSSTNPATMIDVGGYAKGYAVDQGIAALRRMGINNAIINAGGDLRAIGDKGGQPWRIGIRHPRQPGVIASLETHGDESIFTSGDYERYFEYQGQRFHHIIDPRTGRPAQGTRSVTIIHKDASTADAAATAVFIAGPTQWRETARAMGIQEAMLIDSAGTIYMTEAMSQRIHLDIDTKTTRVIVVP